MVRIGLTGGIGAGKSEASRRLAELGAVIVDADAIAREVVAPGSRGLAEIVEQFGPGVLDGEGGLDRAALGAVVFADEAKRGLLNAIVHPRVRARAAEIEEDADEDAVVVHDIPLLVETGQGGDFDVVVVVDAPDDQRIERLVRLRGMSADDATARIRAQASRAERLAVADVVLDNSGSLEGLRADVDALWEERLSPEARRRRH